MARILVVAGSAKEFEEWLAFNGVKPWYACYLSDVAVIGAHEYQCVIFTGEWRLNALAYCEELTELEQRIRVKRRTSE